MSGFNLIFSYGVKSDHKLGDDGNIFLGAGTDDKGSEVHVFLRKDMTTSENVPCNKCMEED